MPCLSPRFHTPQIMDPFLINIFTTAKINIINLNNYSSLLCNKCLIKQIIVNTLPDVVLTFQRQTSTVADVKSSNAKKAWELFTKCLYTKYLVFLGRHKFLNKQCCDAFTVFENKLGKFGFTDNLVSDESCFKQ